MHKFKYKHITPQCEFIRSSLMEVRQNVLKGNMLHIKLELLASSFFKDVKIGMLLFSSY